MKKAYNFKVTEDVLVDFAIKAEDNDLSVSAVIKHLINDYLNEVITVDNNNAYHGSGKYKSCKYNIPTDLMDEYRDYPHKTTLQTVTSTLVWMYVTGQVSYGIVNTTPQKTVRKHPTYEKAKEIRAKTVDTQKKEQKNEIQKKKELAQKALQKKKAIQKKKADIEMESVGEVKHTEPIISEDAVTDDYIKEYIRLHNDITYDEFIRDTDKTTKIKKMLINNIIHDNTTLHKTTTDLKIIHNNLD